MFAIKNDLSDLDVKDRNIYKILYSMNSHPVATPEMSVEEARCYILFFSEGPNLSAFIGLYLPRTDRKFFYTYSSNPFPMEGQADVEDEARNFAEDMGFLLDEINVGGMAVEDRNHWIEEQYIFGYKKPETAEEASAEAEEDAEDAEPEQEPEQDQEQEKKQEQEKIEPVAAKAEPAPAEPQQWEVIVPPTPAPAAAPVIPQPLSPAPVLQPEPVQQPYQPQQYQQPAPQPGPPQGQPPAAPPYQQHPGQPQYPQQPPVQQPYPQQYQQPAPQPGQPYGQPPQAPHYQQPVQTQYQPVPQQPPVPQPPYQPPYQPPSQYGQPPAAPQYQQPPVPELGEPIVPPAPIQQPRAAQRPAQQRPQPAAPQPKTAAKKKAAVPKPAKRVEEEAYEELGSAGTEAEEAVITRPNPLEATSREQAKLQKPKAPKTFNPTGTVTRDKEALARLLASF